MNDTKVLLERIAAFRQRLDKPAVAKTPYVLKPMPAAAVVESTEAFDRELRTIAGPGEEAERPLPQKFTARAHRLLQEAHALIAWQRKFNADPVFAGIAATSDADPVVAYHLESVAMMDSAVRLVQAFPESPSVQLKLCDGLEGVLQTVKQRHTVQDRALAKRKSDIQRIDRLAAVYTALHQKRAVTLKPLAALAEELLEDARQSKPLRFLEVPATSTTGYAGGMEFPAPARFIAAHAINVAQVVVRIVGFDFEWAARPLLPVVAALIMDCGMMRVPAEVLAKPGPLSTADRRLIEEHARHGSDAVLVYLAESAPLAEAIATHHERPDGTGYPLGLKGEFVKPLSRMLAAAETYAALSANRPHRAAHDSRSALTETLMLAEQGKLDKDFCEYLISLTFYPVGTVVELTDGRVGIVAANHPNRMDPRASARPIVAVLAEADGTLSSRPEHLDLSASERGAIVRALSVEQRRKLLGQRYPDLV